MPHTLEQFGRNRTFREAPDLIGSSPKLKNASKQSVKVSDGDSVGVTSILYDMMSKKWDLIEDLWGGTSRMRDAGEKWLPKEPKEEAKSYKNRLNRSILFNALKSTIGRLVSKPFPQSVTVADITDSNIEKLNLLSKDVDGTGRNLTQFSREVFESGLKYGLTHILVDFTNLPSDVETKEDEDFISPRPFFVHVQAPNLIFWDIQEHPVTRLPTLVEIRIKEVTVERRGNNSDVEVIRIRVYKEDVWELWKFNDEDDTFDREKFGVNTFGAIPLVTFYPKRTGQLTGAPPFEDLAWLNLGHWQSSSDQRNILRFARAGVLKALGFGEEELEDIAWGPNFIIKSTNDKAIFDTVEYSGTAIKAGEEDLLRIEERMQLLGLQPFIEHTAQSTATGKVLDESKVVNDIQAWIKSLENTLSTAYDLAAMWLQPDSEGVKDLKLNIFSDFSVSMHGTKDLEALIKMRNMNFITPETFLREVKRRGILSETVEVEEELAELLRSEDNIEIPNNEEKIFKRDA